jgi:hypothetical protein
MAKSKIDKRHFHKKQRVPMKQLNSIIRNGSMEDLEDFEDGMFNSYDENSNNYTTMRSNEIREHESY